jgi:hypothetical protein
MSTKKEPELFLILIPAPDEPPLRCVEYQVALRAFAKSLNAHGLEFSSSVHMKESAYGGGFSLGEFAIIAKTIGTALPVLIGAWLREKYGRKVKLKFQDVEVEAVSVEEAEKLIKLAEKHRKKRAHKR